MLEGLLDSMRWEMTFSEMGSFWDGFFVTLQVVVAGLALSLILGTLLSLGLTGWDLAVLWIGVAIMLAAEWYQEKQGPIRPMLETKPAWFQWLTTMVLPLAILFCLGVLRADYIPEGFIYQQF